MGGQRRSIQSSVLVHMSMEETKSRRPYAEYHQQLTNAIIPQKYATPTSPKKLTFTIIPPHYGNTEQHPDKKKKKKIFCFSRAKGIYKTACWIAYSSEGRRWGR